MEKAILKVNLKTTEGIIPEGAEFTPPFPAFVSREREAGADTIRFVDISDPEDALSEDSAEDVDPSVDRQVELAAKNQAMINEMFSEAEVDEAEEKLKLANYAMEVFGEKLDRRKTLEVLRQQVEDLEAAK